MKPYILDEAWIKLEDGEFVFCGSHEADGSVSLRFEIGTGGESWAINSIGVFDGWNPDEAKPLTGRLEDEEASQ